MLSLEMVLYNGAEQNVLLLPDPFSQSGASGRVWCTRLSECQTVWLCTCSTTDANWFAMVGNRLSVRAPVSLTLVRPSHICLPHHCGNDVCIRKCYSCTNLCVHKCQLQRYIKWYCIIC